VTPVGLDEVLFSRQGRWRTHAWSTTIADVTTGRLLDIIEGRSATGACRWFDARPPGWCEQIDWAVLDLSGPWRLTFDTVVPWATQIADPFHVTKLANQRLDEVRRAGSRTRPSAIEAASTIRSTGPAGCSPAPTNASMTAAAAGCSACWTPAIRATRCAPRGTRRRWSARSMTTTTLTSRSSSSLGLVPICRTKRVRPKSASSAAPSCDGDIRSPPGTEHTSPTGRPRR
jgi:hypothetical protein